MAERSTNTISLKDVSEVSKPLVAAVDSAAKSATVELLHLFEGMYEQNPHEEFVEYVADEDRVGGEASVALFRRNTDWKKFVAELANIYDIAHQDIDDDDDLELEIDFPPHELVFSELVCEIAFTISERVGENSEVVFSPELAAAAESAVRKCILMICPRVTVLNDDSVDSDGEGAPAENDNDDDADDADDTMQLEIPDDLEDSGSDADA